MAYRPEWWNEAVGSNCDLCSIALHIHCAISGSGDDESIESLEPKARALQWVVDNWKPATIPRHAAFDEAVRCLVVAALDEFNKANRAGTRFYE